MRSGERGCKEEGQFDHSLRHSRAFNTRSLSLIGTYPKPFLEMSRKQQLSIATLLAFAFFIGSTIAVPLPTSPVTNLVFGSCNAHNRDQSIWKSIINANPDIFVWLGDVVYADTMKIPLIGQATPIPEMRAKFDAQKNSPLYSQLRSKTPIVGVWVRSREREHSFLTVKLWFISFKKGLVFKKNRKF